NGWVVKENYDGLVGVNGHSKLKGSSGNTNFAFLVDVALTEPVEDTIEYGRAIADLATTIGGGKPLIQRLGDLRRGRRTKAEYLTSSPFENTLKDVTPGDVSMALPHRIVTDILEGLERLNAVIPGVNSDSTFLYAPEIKFYSMRVEVDKGMRTSIRGLYAAGDGAGLSRDIVNSAATGILAAEGILGE
ncbi:MAG: FAD-dependent oxidoreductase, partial [Candidatus Altiarchaeota archaeon]